MRQLVCRLTGAYVFTVFTEVNILLRTLPVPRAGPNQIQGLSVGSVCIYLQSHDSGPTEGRGSSSAGHIVSTNQAASSRAVSFKSYSPTHPFPSPNPYPLWVSQGRLTDCAKNSCRGWGIRKRSPLDHAWQKLTYF